MIRQDGRKPDQIRDVSIKTNFVEHAEGSCLIELGKTRIICTATIEDKVPAFLKDSGQGWVTAEYSMLPRATKTRHIRESSKGKLSGRTQEIQRLIGRSLRSCTDLSILDGKTVWIDCDVIQADGGTRTASVTGGFVALYLALRQTGLLHAINSFMAAISVGVVAGEVLLDLNYEEDSMAEVDMNIVMNESGEFAEIQGTAEENTFSKETFYEMLQMAEKGIGKMIDIQKEVLGVR